MSNRIFFAAGLTGLLVLFGCGDDDRPAVDAGGGDATTMDGGGDPCDGLAICSTAGTSCDGDLLVTCAANADGCLVETRRNCGAMGGSCDDSGATAMCTADPCDGVARRCTTEGRTCDGDTLVECAMDAMGCLVETDMDCSDMGGICSDVPDPPACMFPIDPCDGVADACVTAGTTCDGDTLVTCAPNAFGCLVETDTDCTARASGTCDDTASPPACAFTGDPCAGVTECAAEGIACDGPELVSCAADGFGCLVETRSDCTGVMFGYCDTDADPDTCDTMAADPCASVVECTPTGRTCAGDTLTVCAPDAFGCDVETTTDCAATDSVCDDSGTAMCVDLCAAAEATVLDCASGTVSGDTATGMSLIDSYECTTFTYPRAESVYVFQNTLAAAVTIVATRISGDGDHDLYAIEGDGMACDGTSACLDSSTGVSATETVDFDVAPGQTVYIAYDLFDSTTGADTTTFSLEVTCDEAVCGDGDLDTGEECDDGATTAGDGCSDTCAFETGYYCSGEPSTCAMVMCGDSTVGVGEGCDDGNTTDGDACSARCALEIAASGSNIMVSGSIDDTDPEWARPEADCASTSPADHYYDVFVIENTTGVDQVLTVTAAWAAGDGYLHAYRYPFEPTVTDFNCVIGDDDFGSPGASGSQITSLSIAAGERLVIVASTFVGGAAIGAYGITVATD